MNAAQRRGWRVPVVEDPMRRIHVAATMHEEFMQRLEWALSVIDTDIPVIEIPIADATPQTGEDADRFACCGVKSFRGSSNDTNRLQRGSAHDRASRGFCTRATTESGSAGSRCGLVDSASTRGAIDARCVTKYRSPRVLRRGGSANRSQSVERYREGKLVLRSVVE
jgi:hypothetical protein